VAGAWRERWWTVDLLLVHGVEALSDTERAQDEFFHLFEALKRRGARVLLLSDRLPGRIKGIDDRLRSRFEGGLVLELSEGTPGSDLILEDERISIEGAALIGVPFLDEASDEHAVAEAGLPTGATGADTRPDSQTAPAATTTIPAPAPAAARAAAARKGGAWFPSRENAVIHWPRIVDLLIEELD
jgi:hypothetical protein